MRESVDEEEQDVGDGEGAAGVKGAILPGAPSCQEEHSHVDLRPEGGKQEELHRPNQQLWLVVSRVVESSPVLHVDSDLKETNLHVINDKK